MLDQGSPAWVRERIGKLTASRMGDVMAMTKAGKPSEARLAYLKQLVAERMTDSAQEFYVTAAMQWGIDNEPLAAEEYESLTGEIVVPAPFVPHPTIQNFGASPDRFVGSDGLIEIKCPASVNYVEWMRTQEIPERHRWQMLAQLACTRRQWCDFVAYDPRVVYGPPIWIKRFEPRPDDIAAVEEAARTFLDEVDQLFELVTQAQEKK
jgi:putative phage-type endonuclease